MNRRRQGVAAICAGVLLAAGAVVAEAATTDPCDALFSSNTIAKLKAYDACRFDRIEAKLNAPTPPPAPTPDPSSPAPDPTSQAPTPTQPPVSPTPTPTQPPAPGGVCDPSKATVTFTGQGSQGIAGNYDVSAEQWGVNGYNYKATEGFCSHDSWYADITTDNAKGDGAVKSYPSVRRIYHDWSTSDFSKDPRLSSFPKLTVDFAATDPTSCSGCIYEDAFDVWANGIGGSNNTELMIWTSNNGQTPYGSKVASGIVVDGRTWDLYSGNSNHYVAYVPTGGARVTSGTVDLKAFFADLVTRGRIASSAYDAQGGKTDPFLGQVSFGVEPVSTGGVSKHWDFEKFTINDGS